MSYPAINKRCHQRTRVLQTRTNEGPFETKFVYPTSVTKKTEVRRRIALVNRIRFVKALYYIERSCYTQALHTEVPEDSGVSNYHLWCRN